MGTKKPIVATLKDGPTTPARVVFFSFSLGQRDLVESKYIVKGSHVHIDGGSLFEKAGVFLNLIKAF